MHEKPKIAFYWCASCGGCEEAVIDLAEEILDVVAAADIVFWPVALDFKRHDVERMPRASILATFLNGAIRTSEQEEMAKLLREKSTYLIAFGSCSHIGGVPGLANFFTRQSILQQVYLDAPTTENPNHVLPETNGRDGNRALSLPNFSEQVRSLDQVVDVDYYLPGCPPLPKIITAAASALLNGQLPEKGSVLAPDQALCTECSRKDSKPDKIAIKQFRRPQEVVIDETQCLLAQGLLCLGPATRAGCEAPCIQGNMPCTGCCGAPGRVRDQGAKALSAIASLIDSRDEAEIDQILATIPDPAGTFYRYSLPASLLHARRGV
jgi:F420-non-reducing hydrogenase small subunit